MAVVTLTNAHFESTLALAVAIAQCAAGAARSPGAFVTVANGLVKVAARNRRGSSLALRGFEPIGRSGGVVLLDAADAHAASIAAAGVVPIVCVITAGDGLGSELTEICPTSLLLVADQSVSDNYVELLVDDLTREITGATPWVLRYSGTGGEDVAAAPALVADASAGLRLRLGLAPGRRSQANAETAVAMLGCA